MEFISSKSEMLAMALESRVKPYALIENGRPATSRHGVHGCKGGQRIDG
jgi:hypothetical protein